MPPRFDIVVLGATGYTGRITCKYLSTHKEVSSWAIAGRNESKLNDLKKELGAAASNAKVFVVDVDKPESLDEMCKSARCVITCAGPFNTCGMPVVEACVRNGVHYIDSAGEFTFARLVALRFHEEAQRRKIAVANCCGFDCVPSDLGNYIVHREAKEELREVKAYFQVKTAGISSGTAHSVANVMNYIQKEDYSNTSLNPVGPAFKSPLAATTRFGMWYDSAVNSWTAPFEMAACNERVVRRSNALLGSAASYVECTQGSFLSALSTTAGFYAMGVMMLIGPLRNFCINRFFPTGVAHGPEAAKKEGAFLRARFIGTTVSGKTVSTTLESSIEMYDITGIFLVECALSALTLEKQGKLVPGVVTPAAGFGDELVRRARDAGVSVTTAAETTAPDQKNR